MSNTANLYRTIATFMQARSETREELQVMTRRYASARGSQMYADEMSKAKQKWEQTIAGAQLIAKQEIRETLKAMAEKADRIKMQPPTEEQLRILQLLKMKNKLTQAECDGAANAMDGNAAALALLDEMANESGIAHVPFARRLAVKTYSPDTARQTIKELGEACFEIVNNTSGASRLALLSKQWHKNTFGGSFDPFDLPQEKPFEDENEFYTRMNIPLSAFSAAVD